jgi:hypothetical protein
VCSVQCGRPRAASYPEDVLQEEAEAVCALLAPERVEVGEFAGLATLAAHRPEPVLLSPAISITMNK